jgi:hypothetical protein
VADRPASRPRIWIAFKVAKRFKSGGAKVAVGLGVVALVLIVPFGDEIAGRIYFSYLCETEGGSKIYQTVEIGKEYILLSGEIDANTAGRLPVKGGELNLNKLKEKYSFETDSVKFSRLFRIERDVKTIRVAQSGKTLASDANLFYFGGWLVNATSPHVSGKSCPARTDVYFDQFCSHVFKSRK